MFQVELFSRAIFRCTFCELRCSTSRTRRCKTGRFSCSANCRKSSNRTKCKESKRCSLRDTRYPNLRRFFLVRAIVALRYPILTRKTNIRTEGEMMLQERTFLNTHPTISISKLFAAVRCDFDTVQQRFGFVLFSLLNAPFNRFCDVPSLGQPFHEIAELCSRALKPNFQK